MRHVTVLGAGLAGLAAAQRSRQLGHTTDVYEAKQYKGGHAATHYMNGFYFDEGPHVSFTKNAVIQDLLAKGVDGQYLDHEAAVTNYWKGHWVRHPAQCNLYGLPVNTIEACLVDFAEEQTRKKFPPKNYEEWCHQGLGKTFSEEFTFRYTRKYWTAEARDLSTDWVGSRVYAPKFSELVRGALSHQQENHHYITKYRYPKVGGFGSYTKAVDSDASVYLGKCLTSVDLQHNKLEFADGSAVSFETLVSSLPLPVLIRCIKDVPTNIAEAADLLVCTSLVLVNIGIDRREGFASEADWMYIYDEDIIFSRLNFPHRLSPTNAPNGCGSIQAEIYYSPYRPLESGDLISRTIEDLYRMMVLLPGDKIVEAHALSVPYANVLFDHARTKNLSIVRAYLATNSILCCGRYGEWEYQWTDDAILSGWRAADTLEGLK